MPPRCDRSLPDGPPDLSEVSHLPALSDGHESRKAAASPRRLDKSLLMGKLAQLFSPGAPCVPLGSLPETEPENPERNRRQPGAVSPGKNLKD